MCYIGPKGVRFVRALVKVNEDGEWDDNPLANNCYDNLARTTRVIVEQYGAQASPSLIIGTTTLGLGMARATVVPVLALQGFAFDCTKL